MKKTVTNETEIRFVSKSENEAFARQAVCSFISMLDPTIEEISDIRIIVSEAVTNCIVHAYKDRLGIISIEVKCFSDRSVRIRIKDYGIGISDIDKCMEPLYTTDQNGERGGMGLPIMNSLADEFKITSKTDTGTTVTALLKIGSVT